MNYIFDNGTQKNLELINHLDGNTFYHESMRYPKIVKKLINLNKMNFKIKNKDKLTPLECISDIGVSNILINQLYIKLNTQEDKIKKLEMKLYLLVIGFFINIILLFIM